jgi:hypothetical protein
MRLVSFSLLPSLSLKSVRGILGIGGLADSTGGVWLNAYYKDASYFKIWVMTVQTRSSVVYFANYSEGCFVVVPLCCSQHSNWQSGVTQNVTVCFIQV